MNQKRHEAKLKKVEHSGDQFIVSLPSVFIFLNFLKTLLKPNLHVINNTRTKSKVLGNFKTIFYIVMELERLLDFETIE